MSKPMHGDGATGFPTFGAPQRRRGYWFSDFRFKDGRLTVHDTGADLALDRTLISEALIWFSHHVLVRARSWWLLATRRNAPRIWFSPCAPRPWYMIWVAMAWGGLRFARSPAEADAAFHFEDATWSAPQPPPLARSFNFRCGDVSKSRVAQAFEAVFGYPLAVDPAAWIGPAVEKSERNGVHDGRVVQCPARAEPGKHYQRLIDTSDGRYSYDLRTHCIGGRPRVVWVKRKPTADQFSIHNLGVELTTPEAVYSEAELANIRRFLAVMGSDWAGLDILRDARTGRIYIVDVNKTDMGPIIALSWRDKLKSAAILARALEEMVTASAAAAARAA